MRAVHLLIAMLFLSACQATTSTVSINSDKPTGIQPNGLKQIKVVEDWQPVADMDIFKQNINKPYGIKTYAFEHIERKGYECDNMYNNVPGLRNSTQNNNQSQTAWYKCQHWYHAKATSNPQLIADILLQWSKNPKSLSFNRGDRLAQGYHIGSAVGTFATVYAFWYNDITFNNPQDRIDVDLFLTRWLTDFNRPVIDPGERKCNVNNYKSVLSESVDSNTCGNMVMKVAMGTITFALRTENQQLLDHGHDHLYVVWSQIDPDGIWVNNASRGNQNFGYTMENIKHLSFFAEIYHNLGYDLFEHTLPHGAKVHEVLKQSYNLLSDFKINAKYAKYNVGSMWTTWNKIKNFTQAQFVQSDYATNSYWYKGGYKQWYNTHARYSNRYLKNEYVEVEYFKRNKVAITPTFPFPMQAMYYANGKENTVISSVTQALQSQ